VEKLSRRVIFGNFSYIKITFLLVTQEELKIPGITSELVIVENGCVI